MLTFRILLCQAPTKWGTTRVNEGLELSERGAALVKSFEGCLRPIDATKTRFEPYVCPAGVLTTGWGHTRDNGRQFRAG